MNTMDISFPQFEEKKPKSKEQNLPVITRRFDEILKAVHFYHYVTAQDIARLLFSERSITHVREILASLSGGIDRKPNQYLFRFPLPDTRTGNTEKIYTLGAKGRQYLREQGLEVDWYFRPSDVSDMSYKQSLHVLSLTHFLVAARFWCRNRTDVTLASLRIQYELEREKPAYVRLTTPGRQGQNESKIKVVPDAWLNFQFLRLGAEKRFFPLLFELDRGMEYQETFKKHVKARLLFIRSGSYQEMFATPSVTIAYATTGSNLRVEHMVDLAPV